MRITADLIRQAPAYMNPLKERELSLRNFNIVKIENLGATEDNYETIDLSDNQIAKLENFPLLKRMQSVLLNNNRVFKISKGMGEYVPSLRSLLLTNNKIAHLADLDPLSEFKKLTHLSLVNNPVTKKEHYRLYVIHKLPSLLILDFAKVKAQERKEAEKLFGGEEGEERVQELKAKEKAPDPSKTFVPGGETVSAEELAAQTEKLHDLIKNATSLAEITKLETILNSGKVSSELLAKLSNGSSMDTDTPESN
eukprot:gb/GEZN01010510.1/.p1 GENE.gb/GEZN01010510.1/~~gb/GEZN01010510.1/.p1  ORF type:complete len:253 (-),score=49.14 gb/GEZN01010510.1/:433-1191(-)